MDLQLLGIKGQLCRHLATLNEVEKEREDEDER